MEARDSATSSSDKLATYRRKRDPKKTPEPVPAGTPARRRRGAVPGDGLSRFVIQEHHAQALHWDFRLERDGVLVSWAVPKGLPLDTKTNRLAVHTEDHPLEYAGFEGEIPQGEYGGGKVVLWDSGTYEEVKWSDREVMVVLHGERIEGKYVLFATERADGKGGRAAQRSWMVHRMDDPPAGYTSPPTEIAPMLATLGSLPTDDAAWAFEFKWDGIRAVTYVDGGRLKISSRNGNDLSVSFPELRALGEFLGAHQAVLDGEIVAFDEHGRPRFQMLQPRIHATSPAKARRALGRAPVVYVSSTCSIDGELLVPQPYAERRRRLEALGLDKATAGSWTLSPRFEGPGGDVLRASREQGLEGILAKRLDSAYLPGKRSPSWTKVKNVLMQEVIVGGFTPGEGSRRGRLGSLLLGIPSEEGLVYVGQVGTGFSDAVLLDLGARLEAIRSETNPFTNDVPPRYAKVATWSEPTLVGEVSFSEWTTDGRLRHPSWRGLREDKDPGEVRRES